MTGNPVDGFRWPDIAAIAAGAPVMLGETAIQRIAEARAIVEAIVARGIRAYGINTGVGALCNVIVAPEQQRDLSRKIVLSHAVGVGLTLGTSETRAIMAAAVANFAHGHSGVRPVVIEMLVDLLNRDCTPRVPIQGSVGYLTHMAHIAVVLIGDGSAQLGAEVLPGSEALRRIGREPLVLDTKEGLSLVNGTPCATGLACLALARAERLLDWADALAAFTFESAGREMSAFDDAAMQLHRSPGLNAVASHLRGWLEGSRRLEVGRGTRIQDALSLRAIPHVHGAARDAHAFAGTVVDRELASVTDNPLVLGTPERPEVRSTAHAVGAGVALAMDCLAIAIAEVAAMSERRLDRLLNPLVSGLPPFLTTEDGTGSGFMIAQYTAVSLVNENRMLAAPASLGGGITSGLQEDHLCHATPASLKCLQIIGNAERIFGIEYLVAAQACDLYPVEEPCAPGTRRLYERLRETVAFYADDRILAADIEAAANLLRSTAPRDAS